jgi:hypothetical protein
LIRLLKLPSAVPMVFAAKAPAAAMGIPIVAMLAGMVRFSREDKGRFPRRDSAKTLVELQRKLTFFENE